MRRRKIVTRALLILFVVVNFVYGAPVAAREKPEDGIDVDVTRDRGTAALQKRVRLENPVDEASTNMGDQTPSSLDRIEVDQLWQEMKKQGMIIGWNTSPFSEGSSTGSNSRPVSPEEPESRSMGSNLLPSSHPVSPPKGHPPLPPALSLTTDTSSTIGRPSTLKQSSGPDLGVHPPQNTGTEPLPFAKAEVPMDEFLDMLMKGKTESPNPVQPPPNAPETRPLPNSMQPPPTPNPGPYRPAVAETSMDISSDVLVKGKRKRPNLVQPPPNPGSHDHPPAANEMPIDEFLDMLMMKGKPEPPNSVQTPPPNPEPHPSAADEMPADTLMKGKMKSLTLVQPPPNPEPHPPAAGAGMPIGDFLDMLMRGKIKRTFLSPVR